MIGPVGYLSVQRDRRETAEVLEGIRLRSHLNTYGMCTIHCRRENKRERTSI